MSHKIDVTTHRGVLWVRVEGAVGRNPMKARPERLEQIGSACVAGGCRGILFDLRRATFDVSMVDVFNAALALAMAKVAGVRVAALDAPVHLGAHDFFRTVAENRGLLYRTFADEAEALAWLRAGDAVARAAD